MSPPKSSRSRKSAPESRPEPKRRPPPTEAERYDAAQARLAALVIAGTMLLWMGLSWLGGKLNWNPRYAFLIDLAAIAAFVWALIVTWRLWQRRRS